MQQLPKQMSTMPKERHENSNEIKATENQNASPVKADSAKSVHETKHEVKQETNHETKQEIKQEVKHEIKHETMVAQDHHARPESRDSHRPTV